MVRIRIWILITTILFICSSSSLEVHSKIVGDLVIELKQPRQSANSVHVKFIPRENEENLNVQHGRNQNHYLNIKRRVTRQIYPHLNGTYNYNYQNPSYQHAGPHQQYPNNSFYNRSTGFQPYNPSRPQQYPNYPSNGNSHAVDQWATHRPLINNGSRPYNNSYVYNNPGNPQSYPRPQQYPANWLPTTRRPHGNYYPTRNVSQPYPGHYNPTPRPNYPQGPYTNQNGAYPAHGIQQNGIPPYNKQINQSYNNYPNSRPFPQDGPYPYNGPQSFNNQSNNSNLNLNGFNQNPYQPRPHQPSTYQPSPYQHQSGHPSLYQPSPHQPPSYYPSAPQQPSPYQPSAPQQPLPYQPSAPQQPLPYQPSPHQPSPYPPSPYSNEQHLFNLNPNKNATAPYYDPTKVSPDRFSY